jgi:hypothetical protein
LPPELLKAAVQGASSDNMRGLLLSMLQARARSVDGKYLLTADAATSVVSAADGLGLLRTVDIVVGGSQTEAWSFGQGRFLNHRSALPLALRLLHCGMPDAALAKAHSVAATEPLVIWKIIRRLSFSAPELAYLAACRACGGVPPPSVSCEVSALQVSAPRCAVRDVIPSLDTALALVHGLLQSNRWRSALQVLRHMTPQAASAAGKLRVDMASAAARAHTDAIVDIWFDLVASGTVGAMKRVCPRDVHQQQRRRRDARRRAARAISRSTASRASVPREFADPTVVMARLQKLLNASETR